MLKRFIIFYALFLVVIIILADSGQEIFFFSTLAKIPWGDKIGHFFLMGVMAYLLTWVTHAERLTIHGKSVLKGPFWLAVIVTLEEISQIWIANRGFSLLDLGFDYLGIIAFSYLALVQR
jgi:VanZ family protein